MVVVSRIVLLYLLYSIALSSGSSSVPLAIFDLSNEKYSLLEEDATSITLPSSIKLGNKTEDNVFIYANGLVSFGALFNESTTVQFPVDDAKIVAPFWDEYQDRINTSRQIKYFVNNVSDSMFLMEINGFLKDFQYTEYTAQWAFIVQWIDVCIEMDNCNELEENVFQLVLTTDGTTSLAIFTYQCSQEIAIHSSTVIGYSVNNELYRQHPVSNFTELACKNLPYSNFTNLVYQLNYGIPLLAVMPIDTIGQEGSSVKFYCTAQAVPHVETVIWRINGVQLPPMGSSHRTISTTQEGDITQSVLTLSSLSRYLDNGNTYTCTVSNSEGSVESVSGNLTINQPAVISAIVPMLINQKENVPAQLSCGAVGQPLPLIKWYSPNGDELMDSDSIRIQTHTSFMSITSFLLFNPLKYEYAGSYNCTAINLAHGLGNPVSMDTQNVTVTVQTGPVLEYSGSTSDIVIVLLGGTLTIEFMIIKAEPAVTINDIEWMFSSNSGPFVPINCSFVTCELAGNRIQIVVENVTVLNEGLYRISVVNTLDEDSRNVTVKVKDHARITTPSVSYDVLNETDQLILHCIATGIPAPVISWTKEQQSFVIPSNNTDPVKDSNGVYTVESILELSSVVYADRGTYICSAVGFGGVDNQTTISYFVEVQTFPIISAQLNEIDAIIGDNVTISIDITRDNPSVQLTDIIWSFEGVSIMTDGKYNFSYDSRRLTVSCVTFNEQGVYTVTVSNPAGKNSANIVLSILAPSTVYTPTPHVIVDKSSIAVLTCIGMGHPLPDIYWKRQDGQILPEEREIIITSTTNNVTLEDQYIQSTLVLSNVTSTDNGGYVCTAINNVTLSLEKTTVLLTVQVKPTLEGIQPDNVVVILSQVSIQEIVIRFNLLSGIASSVVWTFMPLIAGKLEIEFQTTLMNSTKHYLDNNYKEVTLTITNATTSDQGLYTVVVINGAGIAQASVNLTIQVQPAVFTTDPSIVQVNEYTNVNLSCVTTGKPMPKDIVWFRNGTLLETRLHKRIHVIESELTSYDEVSRVESILVIENANSLYDNGLYTCRSSNGIGQQILHEPIVISLIRASTQSNNCSLLQPCTNGGTCIDTVYSYYCVCTFYYTGSNCSEVIVNEVPPRIVNPPQNTTVDLYGQLTLTCTVTGSPVPRVTWYKDGEVVSDSDVNTNDLTIVEMSLKDRGFYHCEATGRSLNGGSITLSSDTVVVNINEIVQYNVNLTISTIIDEDMLSSLEFRTNLVNKVNEIIAGKVIDGKSRLLDVEYLESIDNLSSNYIPIAITLIYTNRSSTELLLALERELNNAISHLLGNNISFSVTNRYDGCESQSTILGSDSTVVIDWPEVGIGEEVFVTCPCGDIDLSPGGLRARRYCGGTFTGGAHWEEATVGSCIFGKRAQALCALANYRPSERLRRLKKQLRMFIHNISQNELIVAGSILLSAVEDARGNNSLSTDFFEVIDLIALIPKEILKESVDQGNTSARLLEGVEILANDINLPENEESILIELETIIINVQAININKENLLVFESFKNSSEQSTNTIFLPEELIKLVSNDTSIIPTLSLLVHQKESLFLRRNQNKLSVNSKIVSASLQHTNVEGLKDPVVITLNANSTNEAQGCYYWDVSLDEGYGDWSQSGCTSENTNGQVICRCSHLTNFAVLLDATPGPVQKVDGVAGKALNAISYIGVITSILCLLITITTYLLSRKLRISERGKLLLNLCFGLLGLYVSFILAIHSSIVPGLCAVVSALLQYFMLVTLFAMASEALNLYMKLVVVFGKQIQKYFLKAVLVSWIVPLLIVIFSFAPNYKQYIGDHFCRVYGMSFYIGVIVPFIIIYIFNLILFGLIMFKLVGKNFIKKYKESFSRDQKVTFRQQFMIALTLSVLFGLSWGLGLLATNSLYDVVEIRDTFSALFVLLTAFHGLFIFLMFCIKSKEVRGVWKAWLSKATGNRQFVSSNTSSSTFRSKWLRRNDTELGNRHIVTGNFLAEKLSPQNRHDLCSISCDSLEKKEQMNSCEQLDSIDDEITASSDQLHL